MADRSNYSQPTYNNISQPRSSTFLDYKTGMERPNNSYAAHYRTAKQNLGQRDLSEWADNNNPYAGAGFNVGALAGAAEGGSAEQFSKIGKSTGGESKKGMSSGLSAGLGVATAGVTQLSQMGLKLTTAMWNWLILEEVCLYLSTLITVVTSITSTLTVLQYSIVQPPHC